MANISFVEIYRKGGFIMRRIDELITEIHTNEIVDIPGELTKEQMSRIEERIIYRRKGNSFRKRTVFLLA